ncbi:hypothetical protein [Leptospira mtsangambouensis]|nr:hypothetical protein [Leptospira mtsangambouensis]
MLSIEFKININRMGTKGNGRDYRANWYSLGTVVLFDENTRNE